MRLPTAGMTWWSARVFKRKITAMMTTESFFMYVLIPLAMSANVLLYAVFRQMVRAKQKISPEHYLLFAVTLILFLLSIIQSTTL